MQGQVLKGRYMISTPLDHGSFGSIHECIDLQKPKATLVIKLSDNYEMLGKEIESLSEIRKLDKNSPSLVKALYTYTPRVLSKGMFLFKKIAQQSDSDQVSIQNVGQELVEASLREGKKFMSYYVM